MASIAGVMVEGIPSSEGRKSSGLRIATHLLSMRFAAVNICLSISLTRSLSNINSLPVDTLFHEGVHFVAIVNDIYLFFLEDAGRTGFLEIFDDTIECYLENNPVRSKLVERAENRG